MYTCYSQLQGSEMEPQQSKLNMGFQYGHSAMTWDRASSLFNVEMQEGEGNTDAVRSPFVLRLQRFPYSPIWLPQRVYMTKEKN